MFLYRAPLLDLFGFVSASVFAVRSRDGNSATCVAARSDFILTSFRISSVTTYGRLFDLAGRSRGASRTETAFALADHHPAVPRSLIPNGDPQQTRSVIVADLVQAHLEFGPDRITGPGRRLVGSVQR